MRQIFLDTETTGLSPESGDRIVEIGCVEMLNRRLSGRHLRTLFRQSCIRYARSPRCCAYWPGERTGRTDVHLRVTRDFT